MIQAGIRHFSDFWTNLGDQRGSVEIEASQSLARTVEEIITLEDRYADSRASSFTLGSAQRGDGRGATGSPKPLEATRIAQALGNGKAVILRNHVSPLLSGSDNGASSYDTQSTRNEAHRWGAARVQSDSAKRRPSHVASGTHQP